MRGQIFYLESSGCFLLTICSDHLHYSVMFNLISQMLEDFWWMNVHSPIQGSCHDDKMSHPQDNNFIATMLTVLIATMLMMIMITLALASLAIILITLTTIIS